jgi:glucose uptake protein GlcU
MCVNVKRKVWERMLELLVGALIALVSVVLGVVVTIVSQQMNKEEL